MTASTRSLPACSMLVPALPARSKGSESCSPTSGTSLTERPACPIWSRNPEPAPWSVRPGSARRMVASWTVRPSQAHSATQANTVMSASIWSVRRAGRSAYSFMARLSS